MGLAFKELKRILSSSNLHFVIGAGFNNNVLPLALELNKTIEKIKKVTKFEINNMDFIKNNGFENWIIDLMNQFDEKGRDNIKKAFNQGIIEDLSLDKAETYDEIIENLNDKAKIKKLEDINNFIASLKKFDINKNKGNGNSFQNKKTFFWSLNYDNLLQKIMVKNKMPHFLIDKLNFDERVLDYTIYYDLTKSFIPTYYIQKIHGNKKNPIIPGNSKYEQLLSDMEIFKGYVNMKNLLDDKHGSNVIIVIGYSWSDGHINQIIKSSSSNTNTIINFTFKTKKKFDIKKYIEGNQSIEITEISDEKIKTLKIETEEIFKTLTYLFDHINNDFD